VITFGENVLEIFLKFFLKKYLNFFLKSSSYYFIKFYVEKLAKKNQIHLQIFLLFKKKKL